MIQHTVDLYGQVPAELRSKVVVNVSRQMLAPALGNQMSYSAFGYSGVIFVKPENSLEYLLVSLFSIVENGIKSPGDAFERYVVSPPDEQDPYIIHAIKIKQG